MSTMWRTLLAIAFVMVGLQPAHAQDANGIMFGEPVTLGTTGLATVGVLVTNTSDQVMSFTVKATYKSGDTIVATASGAVNDLMAGQVRAAMLLSMTPIPSAYDGVRVDVDTLVVRQPRTAGADAAAQITFGRPFIRSLGGLSTVEIEVTNSDSAAHSFTVQLAALSSGQIVGVASGAVNDLGAGQTKTASLLASGQIPNGADYLLSVDMRADGVSTVEVKPISARVWR